MNALHGLMLFTVAGGLLACATPAHGQALQAQRGGYGVEVLVDGARAPTFEHRGETYVLGQLGERYVLRVNNYTGRRVEAVVSVDGRDVIDGRTADYARKRGYLVPAWGSVEIDGWRLSQREAAAFRFSSVARSYAGRMGSPRHVGVIGVAVFPERAPVSIPHSPWRPDGYRDEHRHDRSRGHAAEEPSRSSAPPPAAPPSSQGAPADSAGRSSGESAPSVADAPRSARRHGPGDHLSRPGLGTEFGEATHSPIQEVHFVRANPTHPALVLGVRYNDRRGLVAVGIDLDQHGPYHGDERYLRGSASPFPAAHRLYAAPPPGWRGQW